MTPSNRPSGPIRRGLTSLCLLALLSGCATAPPVTLIQREKPPAHLLLDCPLPAQEFRTNADLLAHILALRGSLRGCNDDKAALREWAESE